MSREYEALQRRLSEKNGGSAIPVKVQDWLWLHPERRTFLKSALLLESVAKVYGADLEDLVRIMESPRLPSEAISGRAKSGPGPRSWARPDARKLTDDQVRTCRAWTGTLEDLREELGIDVGLSVLSAVRKRRTYRSVEDRS